VGARRMIVARTRVLIGDNHPVCREGLRTVLSAQKELEVVGEGENTEIAVNLVRTCRPDVVLMGVAKPVCRGEMATRRILRLQPKCKVLAWSTCADEHSVQQMLDAGAVGYLTKDADPDELMQAIHTIAAASQYFFSPEIAGTAQRFKVARNAGNRRKNFLSACESEVLKLIANGLTSSVIAIQLRLGMGKVRYCRERVMEKLSLRSVAELTQYAIANGLVSLGDGSSSRAVNGTSSARLPNLGGQDQRMHSL